MTTSFDSNKLLRLKTLGRLVVNLRSSKLATRETYSRIQQYHAFADNTLFAIVGEKALTKAILKKTRFDTLMSISNEFGIEAKKEFRATGKIEGIELMDLSTYRKVWISKAVFFLLLGRRNFEVL